MSCALRTLLCFTLLARMPFWVCRCNHAPASGIAQQDAGLRRFVIRIRTLLCLAGMYAPSPTSFYRHATAVIVLCSIGQPVTRHILYALTEYWRPLT